MGLIVNKKHFADVIGKSPRHVTNLIDEGLPCQGGGRGHALEIDTEKALNWLIQREIFKRIGDGDEEGAAETDEDRALKRVRREKIELEIKKARGHVVPLCEISDLLLSISSVFGSRLDSLASRLSSDLAVEDDPAVIRERIFKECRDIRSATADRFSEKVRSFIEGLDEIFGEGE